MGRAMQVVVAGAGLMGTQIGVEYALGGHMTTFLARNAEAARQRLAATFELVSELGLASPRVTVGAQERALVVDDLSDLDPSAELAVESIVEQIDDKIALLRDLAERLPAAILASNTSSLSISALGEGAGAAERLIGTHYWNPPLLMPLVEVIATDRVRPDIVPTVTSVLTALGKRPVRANRDVPGFIWNRMQLALLREAVWLADAGVATPEAIDQVVREGLARRWRYTGPFQTAALGGATTFERIANNLWPVLSNADHLDNLRQWLDEDPESLQRTRLARDQGLREDLARDQADKHVGP
jgi:3-hydroxybutyryl-CoA dehydrogenase